MHDQSANEKRSMEIDTIFKSPKAITCKAKYPIR